MSRMPELDLDAIKARTDAATPGPWIAGGAFTHPWEVCIAAHLPFVELIHTAQGGADAEFIAHARQDVPALLAEAKRLRLISTKLARRLADHATCDEHPLSSPAGDCPFCGDRAAYLEYVGAGGRDFRPDHSGPGIEVFELIRRLDGGESR